MMERSCKMSNETLQKRLDDAEKRNHKLFCQTLDMREKHEKEVYELEERNRKLEKQLEDFDAPLKRLKVALEVMSLFKDIESKGEEQVQADIKNYIDNGALPNTP
jgi:hypothetical protein